jgi:hypothetical protein
MSQFDIGHFVKLSISILYFSGNEGFRLLMKLAGRSPPPRFTILYYHAKEYAVYMVLADVNRRSDGASWEPTKTARRHIAG